MNLQQIPLMNVDPLIKIGEAEVILARVFRPVPDRKTIQHWLEDGTLEGKQIGRGRNWYVFESSLADFIASAQNKLAA